MRRSCPPLLIALLLFTPILLAEGGPPADSARSAFGRSPSSKAKPAAGAAKSETACAHAKRCGEALVPGCAPLSVNREGHRRM